MQNRHRAEFVKSVWQDGRAFRSALLRCSLHSSETELEERGSFLRTLGDNVWILSILRRKLPRKGKKW